MFNVADAPLQIFPPLVELMVGVGNAFTVTIVLAMPVHPCAHCSRLTQLTPAMNAIVGNQRGTSNFDALKMRCSPHGIFAI